MKKIVYLCLFALVAGLALQSCSEDETYAEQKDKERKAIASFLNRDVAILNKEGDTLIHVGRINVIKESTFQEQDSTTNLEKNEYVLFGSSGIYMQVIRKGAGEKLKSGENKQIICRFVEYNILGDSVQNRSDVLYWATTPDIMSVSNSYGVFSGSFNTSINGGGAMYSYYRTTSVPSGWLVPFTYINIGRQISQEGIAKIRLILPHSSGQEDARSNVYPCFYEITFQEMR